MGIERLGASLQSPALTQATNGPPSSLDWTPMARTAFFPALLIVAFWVPALCLAPLRGAFDPAIAGLGEPNKKSYFEEELEKVERLYGSEDPRILKFLLRAADSLELTETKGLPLYLRAVDIIESRKNDTLKHLDRIALVKHICERCSTLPQAQMALDWSRKAFAAYDSFLDPDSRERARLLLNLARAFQRVGDFDQVRQTLDRSRETYAAYYSRADPDSGKWASLLMDLAHAYRKAGDFSQAHHLALCLSA